MATRRFLLTLISKEKDQERCNRKRTLKSCRLSFSNHVSQDHIIELNHFNAVFDRYQDGALWKALLKKYGIHLLKICRAYGLWILIAPVRQPQHLK